MDQYNILASWRKDELYWTNTRLTQYISSRDDALNLLWGLARGEGETITRDRRLASVSSTDAADTTHTLGVSYKFIDNGSDAAFNHAILFANQATSFQIQAGNQQDPKIFEGFTSLDALKAFIATVQPNSVEPQRGDGYEVGIRFDLFQRRLRVNALYFDQTRENIARSFFVRASIVPGVDAEDGLATYLLAGGVENSKGVEFSFDFRPIRNLVVIGEAMISKGEVEANPEAPEEIGFGLVRSPENMFGAWIRYDFSDTVVSGLSVGLGASYNSSARIRPQVPDRFRVSDDYTNVRAMIRYKFRAFDMNNELGLNIDNLLDDEYTQEDNFLSEPRLFKLTYSTVF
ncbi:MAG: TonB-dependent receptor domain-containing protein [Opitutaceae bacterium]